MSVFTSRKGLQELELQPVVSPWCSSALDWDEPSASLQVGDSQTGKGRATLDAHTVQTLPKSSQHRGHIRTAVRAKGRSSWSGAMEDQDLRFGLQQAQ